MIGIGLELALLFLTPIFCSFPIMFAWVYRPGTVWAERLSILSVAGLFVSLITSLHILFTFPLGTYTIHWLPSYNINFTFIFDYLSKYMGALTALIAFLIGVYGLEYMKGDYRLAWYWMFFNLFTASMLLVVYSDNLLMLIIGWEGLGIASWALIGHWFRDDDELSFVGKVGRKLAGLNFFWSPSTGGWRAISTIRIGDMPMFFAVAAIFALVGTLDISQIPWDHMFSEIGYAGVVILLLSFLIGPFTKSAQVPFSEWLMTAMTGPTTVSALLHSATMVAAGAYLFMRLTWYIEPWALHIPGLEIVYLAVLFVGLISALYGSLCAIGMLEKKVLLASSTMASLGLMFGATASSFWVGELGVLVGFWYLMTHAFAKASLFLVSGHHIHATHSRFSFGDLAFGKRMKTSFVTTIIATIFLVGIPPLTAYWVKSAMDEVIHQLVGFGMTAPFVLLIVASLAYSGMLAKFLSLNFIKGEKPPEEHLGGGKVMMVSYAIMVSVLFILLYLILSGTEVISTEFIHAGHETTSFAVGLGVLAAYIFGVFKPRISALAKIGRTLSDRIYFPFINDLAIPKPGWLVSKLVDYANRGIDWSTNLVAMPSLFSYLSRNVLSVQVGYLRTYVKIAMAFVTLVLVVAMIVMVGW